MAWVSLPLLLIWMPGMGLWLSLGPAQANGSRRLGARERGDGGLPGSRPKKPGTARIPGRYGHHRPTGRGRTVRASGNSGPVLPMRNHRPLTISQKRAAAATAQPGDLVTVRHGRPPGQLQAAGNAQVDDADVHLVSIIAAR